MRTRRLFCACVCIILGILVEKASYWHLNDASRLCFTREMPPVCA